MYPAYPRHFFSLRGLVHICIPQTGTPCGRGLCQQVLRTLVSRTFRLCLPSPFVPFLYHTLRDLSRGFSNFFEKSFRLALSHSYQCLGVCGLLPSPLDTLIVSQLGRFVKGFLKNFSKISSVVATGLVCNCPPSHPRREWSLGHIVLGLPSTAP